MIPLYGVVGPTGTGKSDLAMALAERAGGQILSCDSAQVFVGLDVGTAKATTAERARVRHHLIDVISPAEQWSAADYAQSADRVLVELAASGTPAVLCGGTGLWMRALVRGIFEAPAIDPEIRAAVRRELLEQGAPAKHEELLRVDPVAAARIQPNDPQRIGRALEVYRQVGVPISKLQEAHGFKQARYRFVAVAFRYARDVLARRIAERTRHMYRAGLVEETQAALSAGIPADSPGLSTIGYREAVQLLQGKLDRDAAVERTTIATRQYAKRQENWFKHEPDVVWIDPAADPEKVWEELRRREAAL